MTLVTICVFFVIFLFCVAGLFSNDFHENWFQHFGLFGGGLTSIAGMYKVYTMDWVPPEMFIFALSVASFAFGTALKVWGFRKTRNGRSTQS